MNREVNVIISLIVVAVLALSSFGYYEATNHTPSKGKMVSLSTGDILNGTVTRIVSLDPAATATLYTIGAYGDLVGVSPYATYPTNSTLPAVPDYPSMNLEEIYNLTPQLVISFDSAYSSGQIDKLLNAGISYLFLNAGSGSNFSVVEQQNTLLGELTGKTHNVFLLNQWMNQSLNTISNQTSNITASKELTAFYYESSGTSIYTTGNNTFFNDFFEYSHLRNVASSVQGGFATVSPELIASNPPDVIYLDQYVNSSALTVYPFNDTPAYKNGSVYVLPNENIFSEPNFRDIYAIPWMIDQAYGFNVTLPALPFALQDNPNPITSGG